MTEQLETGGGKWSAFVLAAAAAGHNSLRGGGLAIGARRAWRVRKCAMFTRVMVHPGVGAGVRWPVSSAPKGYSLGSPDARADSGAGLVVSP